MPWRLATVIIVLFWAVMTVLLVRHTYFPVEAEFAPMPVAMVLQRYVGNHNASNTLQLMQGEHKRGNATFMIGEWKDPATGAHKGFTWQAGGTVEDGPQSQSSNRITWSFSGDLAEGERWERIALGARSSSTDTTVNIGWKAGQELPLIEVRKEDRLIMDTQQALEQARQSPMMKGMGGFTSMIPGLGGKSPALSLDSLIRLSAREGAMPLGGQRRKAFVLNLSLMGLYQTKAWFTEAGELARVDLPQEFRLVDTMLLGLDAAERGK